jgi:4-aminobutyrate aminotransferase
MKRETATGRPPGVSEREQGDVNTTAQRQAYWERRLSGEARRWWEEDRKYFLHQSLSTPVLNVLKGASGAWIEDLDGRRYLDMHGNGVHNAGFNNPHVIAAVRAALDSGLTFTPRRYTNIPAIELARKLAQITPEGLTRSLFCPGGSEAIEMALMLAKQVTGRFKTISYWDSYHGTTMGAASVSGEELFHGGAGPMVPGAFHVEFPNYYRNPWKFTDPDDVDTECLRQIETILRREPDVAAIIGEPISATPVMPRKQYWEGVQALCKRHGALLIFDEVIEGFGRTGRMFASEHYVTPDVLVLGKSLGGGIVPFAGIVTREEYNVLQHRSIGHYTHEKNPLCAAAGLAEIEYIERENLVQHARELGEHAKARLAGMQSRHPMIGDIAGTGLHLGIDLVRDRATRERAVEEAEQVMFKAFDRGVAFKVIEGNVITLRPSLVITREEMDFVLDVLDESIGAVENGG